MIELQPPVRSSERGGLPSFASFRYLPARQGRAHSGTGIVACVLMDQAHFDVGAWLLAHVPCGGSTATPSASLLILRIKKKRLYDFYLNAPHTMRRTLRRTPTRLHVHNHVSRLAHDLRLAYGVL